MKKIKVFKIALLLCCACLFPGCDEDKAYNVDETIYVNYNSLDLYYGDKYQLTTSPLAGAYEWSSDDISIAKVSASGEVEAVGIGSTNIHVTDGKVKKAVPVTVTIPAINKATGRPGKERAQIEVEILSNLIKTIRITRLDTEEYMDVDINFASGVFTMFYNNLEEANYSFSIVSMDKYGMESAPTNLDIQVYGAIYQNKIVPRTTKAATAFGNGLAIGWGNEAGTFIDLYYKNVNGEPVSNRSSANIQATYLFNYKHNSDISYITGYLPEKTAVDTFNTQPVVIEAAQIKNIMAVLTSSGETIIAAGHFDLGGDGKGFHDSDASNSANNYAFRENLGDYNSRGVDIESGGNIGYTNANEWLMYTVYVEDPGTYAIDFLISVNGSSTSCHIEVDGNALPSYSLINNSSWGDYRYYCERNGINPPTYKLTKGFHTIKFYFETGNFNYNGLKVYFKE